MSLKVRIDTVLGDVYTEAPDWDKPIIGRRTSIRCFSTRYNGTVIAENGFPVPSCTVRFWVSTYEVGGGVDVEDEINALLQHLNTVDDCYPQQEPVEVEYKTANDRNHSKYVSAEVICNGA